MIDPDRERGPSLNLSFETPGLASDLEWALQSSQVEAPVVLEALLHTFYPPIFQITQALEPDPIARERLARQAFVAGTQNRYRFRSGMDVTAWFYQAALLAFPRPARREAWPPLAITLHAFGRLSTKTIASVLDVPPEVIAALLEQADQQPTETLRQAGWEIDEAFAADLERDWRAALSARYPPPAAGQVDLEALADALAVQAERQGFRLGRWLTLREVVWVGLLILAVAGLILIANRLFPASEPEDSPPGLVTQIVTRIVEAAPATPGAAGGVQAVVLPYATPTPWPTPTPVRTVEPLPTLPAGATPLSLSERLSYSTWLWNTAWGEAVLTFHGGPGYLGADRHQRVQFWISGNQLRLVSGPLGGAPQRVWIGQDGRVNGFIFAPGQAAPTRVSLSYSGSFKNSTTEANLPELRQLFPFAPAPGKETRLPSNLELRPVGTDVVARRPALIVDVRLGDGRSLARLWLDRTNLAVLRGQYFSPTVPDQVIVEMQMDHISFDVGFTDQRLFDLEDPQQISEFQGRLRDPALAAMNPPQAAGVGSPGQASLPDPGEAAQRPPAGFDPGRLALSFLYPPDFDLYQNEVRVQIFAEDPTLGSLRLGRTLFGNPWMLTCARSPDGRRIAYTSQSLLSGQVMPAVRWIDLTDLRPLSQRNLPIQMAQQIAFAPDGQTLAIVGAGDKGFGVYLFDLETGDPTRFFSTPNWPDGLVWSPDGEYLAWTSQTPATGRQLTVVGRNGPQPIYQGEYSDKPVPLTNSPLGEWQVPPPASTGGLESCAAPPKAGIFYFGGNGWLRHPFPPK